MTITVEQWNQLIATINSQTKAIETLRERVTALESGLKSSERLIAYGFVTNQHR